MPPSTSMDKDLESISWDFLESEFTGTAYAGWSIDRRLQVYLRHHGLAAIADDGTACAALLERVMANIGPALRRGVLSPPKEQIPS
ncbi:hypothetical protein [Mycolicibacterium hippocampi]